MRDEETTSLRVHSKEQRTTLGILGKERRCNRIRMMTEIETPSLQLN
jgi:hypothetical protein